MVRETLTPEALSALEPRDAAAYFIARRAEGLTDSEQQLLADWLAKDEAHGRLFDSADRVWQSFADSEDDEILAAMRAHARAPRSRSLGRWWPAAAVAAGLILAAGLTLNLSALLNPRSPPGDTIEYASARGEVKELKLPDGSSMTLDADSAAIGRFNANRRTVELRRGRAFFEVIPDRARPFSVDAAGHRVVTIGTRFDVNLAADGFTVTLLAGRVEIGSPNAPVLVTLETGQQYSERFGKVTVRTVGAARENAITWRLGLINFDDQPLAEAAAVMNRYSRDQIVISDPDVASIRVSGQFRAGDAQRFADTLAEMHKLNAMRRGEQIELVRKN